MARPRRPAFSPAMSCCSANSQPVPDAAALTTLLAGRKADEDMTLDLKDKAGAAKKSDVKVFMTPRLIGLNDQSLLINKILVDLRGRLEQPGDPVTDSVMRLEPGGGAGARRRLVGGPARAAAREVERRPGRVGRHRAVPARPGRGANGQHRRSRGGLAGRGGEHGARSPKTDLPVKDLAEARLQGLQRRPGQH